MGNGEDKPLAARNDDLDLTRVPTGERVAAALVRALALRDDRVEGHHLEVKSVVSMNTRGFAKIAKYILGSANRMPESAATAFEGHGVMVIGVDQGEVRGVPYTEILALERGVSPHLGPDGPRWDLTHVRVPGSDNTVLVIVVDPPRDGQGPSPVGRKVRASSTDGCTSAATEETPVRHGLTSLTNSYCEVSARPPR